MSARKCLARYDAVIWLQTAASLGLYDGEESNFCRFEDAAGAIKSGELLLHLWSGHPKLMRVGAFHHLDEKLAAVQEAIRKLEG